LGEVGVAGFKSVGVELGFGMESFWAQETHTVKLSVGILRFEEVALL
jgi:hypothetical protein